MRMVNDGAVAWAVCKAEHKQYFHGLIRQRGMHLHARDCNGVELKSCVRSTCDGHPEMQAIRSHPS